MNKTLTFALLVGVIGVFSAALVIYQIPQIALGSVPVGNQYVSTTTPTVVTHTNLCPARVGMASSTTGVLGNVNITIQGTTGWTIWDATTTDVSLRSADQATSTIRLIHFGAGTPAGSYQIDAEFKRGLVVDYSGANTASSTISYRCEG